MEKIILKAQERTEKLRDVRNGGFVPGVLYGAGSEATSVQFNAAALQKVITKYGHNAKMWIELNDTQKFGFIKEVQKHPVEGKVIHIDVQMVSQDQEIKLLLPINYSGLEELEKRLLVVQVTKNEVEVVGKASILPNGIVIDVANMKSGDTITYQNFDLDEEIKNNDAEDEIYALIKDKKEQVEEEETSDETSDESSEVETA